MLATRVLRPSAVRSVWRSVTAGRSGFGAESARSVGWSGSGAWRAQDIVSQHHRCLGAASSTDDDVEADKPKTLMQRLLHPFSREASVAPEGYNRWLVVPGSFLVQLSIGSVYAWSIFNEPLTRLQGVIAPSSADWELGSVVPIFSACAVTLGVCTFGLGTWAERVGPRMVAATAALSWSTGLVLTGIGCMTHTLPLMYLGYGVFGGAGWALGYISPVSNLIKWFPDRRGLASGMALTAFGGGAMIATPLNEVLMKRFFKAPEQIGTVGDAACPVVSTDETGRRVAEVAGEIREVVIAGSHEVARFGQDIVDGGVYLAGTGDAGTASTFFALSSGYLVAMLGGALLNKVPPANYNPTGQEGSAAANSTAQSEEDLAASIPLATQPKPLLGPSIQPSRRSLDASAAMKTPQFYLLWAACMGNAIAGVTVISCAKTIMNDCFATALPLIVTGGFAASYVAALSAANMFGRLGWASGSDIIGRKNAYMAFAAGAPLCLGIPILTGWVSTDPGTTPLILFFGGTWLIVSFYGGVFSVLPAYIADLFGQKHVGAIHGRLLTAWSGAALTGPPLLTWLRDKSQQSAITDLAAKAGPERFQEAFGAPMERLQDLAAAKTVTISRLMDIVPPGTPDPTPTLYDSTMYSMAGVLGIAAIANISLRNIPPDVLDRLKAWPMPPQQPPTNVINVAVPKVIDSSSSSDESLQKPQE